MKIKTTRISLSLSQAEDEGPRTTIVKGRQDILQTPEKNLIASRTVRDGRETWNLGQD